MCNTVITLSKVIFHSFLYVYQRVIYEDCTNLPIICFAVGIGIHWKPLETIGSTIFCWSVQSMFHGGCPIAGWFHTDNPEMADFRGPFHETSIPNRKNRIYKLLIPSESNLDQVPAQNDCFPTAPSSLIRSLRSPATRN